MSHDEDISASIALTFDDGKADQAIRRVWHNNTWFFSMVDVVGVLTDPDSA